MNESTQTTGSLLREMDRAQCFERLGYGSYVGRVGFVHDGKPMILPVNYLLDGDAVIFSTRTGTMLSGLAGEVVAFEVDDNRPLGHAGWSVVVQGVVHSVTDGSDLERLRRGPLRAWAWHATDCWFRISIDSISGRHVRES